MYSKRVFLASLFLAACSGNNGTVNYNNTTSGMGTGASNSGGSGGSGGAATSSGGATGGAGGSSTGPGGSTGGGGVAGSGGMTTSMAGAGGMAGSGGSGGNTMTGSCDNGVLVSPAANTDMKSADVNGGAAGPIMDGSNCWVPSGIGDSFVVSYAYGMSPCNGQSVAASAVAGLNVAANCPGVIEQYNGCSQGCVALNTQPAMQGVLGSLPMKGNFGDALLTCNGQRGVLVYECVAQQAKQPPQQQ